MIFSIEYSDRTANMHLCINFIILDAMIAVCGTIMTQLMKIIINIGNSVSSMPVFPWVRV